MDGLSYSKEARKLVSQCALAAVNRSFSDIVPNLTWLPGARQKGVQEKWYYLPDGGFDIEDLGVATGERGVSSKRPEGRREYPLTSFTAAS